MNDWDFRREEATSVVSSNVKPLMAFRFDSSPGSIRPHPHAGQAGWSFVGAQFGRAGATSLQNIRLGSAAANPLSKSRNQWADGDGCVEFAPRDGWTVGDGLSNSVVQGLHRCRTSVSAQLRLTP
jgi:hypothetical protein